jgi:hypothetical protein
LFYQKNQRVRLQADYSTTKNMSLEKVNSLFRFKIKNYEENVAPALEDFFNEIANNITSMDSNDVQVILKRTFRNNIVLIDGRTPFTALVIHLMFEHYPDHMKVSFEDFMDTHNEYIVLNLAEEECHSLHEFYNYMQFGLDFYGQGFKAKSLIVEAVSHLSSGPLNGRVYATGAKPSIHAKHRIAIYEELSGTSVTPMQKKRQAAEKRSFEKANEEWLAIMWDSIRALDDKLDKIKNHAAFNPTNPPTMYTCVERELQALQDRYNKMMES